MLIELKGKDGQERDKMILDLLSELIKLHAFPDLTDIVSKLTLILFQASIDDEQIADKIQLPPLVELDAISTILSKQNGRKSIEDIQGFFLKDIKIPDNNNFEKGTADIYNTFLTRIKEERAKPQVEEPKIGTQPDVALQKQPLATDSKNNLQNYPILKKLGINSLNDLALSPLFSSANLLASTQKDLLPLSALGHLIGDEQNIQDFQNQLGLSYVQQLANWPIYLYARKEVAKTLFIGRPSVTSDPYANGTPIELEPRMNEHPSAVYTFQTLTLDAHLDPTLLSKASASYFYKNPAAAMLFQGSIFNAYSPSQEITTMQFQNHGQFDLQAISKDGVKGLAYGLVLDITQKWYPLNLGLGNLLYSLPLAAGKDINLALINWERKVKELAGESISESEQLNHSLSQGRAIDEITKGVINEAQSGFSNTHSTTNTTQSGSASGGGIVGLFNLGGSKSSASTTSDATTVTSSTGMRDIMTTMTQRVNESVHQNTSLVRSRRATAFREVTQSEQAEARTRRVTNYNHMHALTYLYFEVIQNYRVTTKISNVDLAVYLPIKFFTFDIETIWRYRDLLARVALTEKIRNFLRTESLETTSITLDNPIPANSGVVWDMIEVKSFERAMDRKDILVGGIRGNQIILDPNLTLISITTPRFLKIIDEEAKHEISISFINTENNLITASHEYDNQGDTITFPEPIILKNVKNIQVRLVIKSTVAGSDRSYITDASSTLGLRLSAGTLNLPVNYDFSAYYFKVPFTNSYAHNRPYAIFSIAQATYHNLIPQPDIISHFNSNTAYYSCEIFKNLDQTLVLTLLSQHTFLGLPLITIADHRPLALVANMLVFRVNISKIFHLYYRSRNKDEPPLSWEDYLKLRGIDFNKPPVEEIIPVPSDGVFAEPVLSRSPAAEKIDMTRFWNWQDSPIPLTASDIQDISLASRGTDSNLTPGQLNQPGVNVVSPSALPNPTGTANIMAGLTAAGIFRDMSGLASTIAATQTGINRTTEGATNAGVQGGANMATAAQAAIAAGEIVRDIIGSFYGVPPAGSKTSVTEQGGKINHGRDMDTRNLESTDSSRGTQGLSQNGAGAPSSGGINAPSSTTLPTTYASYRSGDGSYESQAFRNSIWGQTGESTGSVIRAASNITSANQMSYMDKFEEITKSPQFALIKEIVSKVAERRNEKISSIMDKIFALITVINVYSDLKDLNDDEKLSVEALIRYPENTIQLYQYMSEFSDPGLTYEALTVQLAQNLPKATENISKIVKTLIEKNAFTSTYALNNWPVLSRYRQQKRIEALTSLVNLAQEIVEATSAGVLIEVVGQIETILDVIKDYYKDLLPSSSSRTYRL